MLPLLLRRPLASANVLPGKCRHASKAPRAALARRHGRYGDVVRPSTRRGAEPRPELSGDFAASAVGPAAATGSLRRAPVDLPDEDELQFALSRFEAEALGNDAPLDLVRASALLALHSDPDLDPEGAVLRPMAQLGDEFRAKARGLGLLAEPMRRQHELAGALCEFLADAGFRGCERSDSGYYRAENSLMHRVLEDRVGIPITLAVVYMAVGREAGLELQGLNFPGHFMLAYDRGVKRGIVDAFENRVVADEEAAATLSRLFRQEVQLDPSWHMQPLVPPVEILARIIRNLYAVYARDGDGARAAWMERYAAVVARLRKRSD